MVMPPLSYTACFPWLYTRTHTRRASSVLKNHTNTHTRISRVSRACHSHVNCSCSAHPLERTRKRLDGAVLVMKLHVSLLLPMCTRLEARHVAREQLVRWLKHRGRWPHAPTAATHLARIRLATRGMRRIVVRAPLVAATMFPLATTRIREITIRVQGVRATALRRVRPIG